MFHFYSLFSKAQFPTGPAEAPGETDWVCVLLHPWTWTSTGHAAMWTTVDRICASHSVTHLFCSIRFIRRRLEIQMLKAWAVGQWQSTCLACGSPRVSSPAMFKKKERKKEINKKKCKWAAEACEHLPKWWGGTTQVLLGWRQCVPTHLCLPWSSGSCRALWWSPSCSPPNLCQPTYNLLQFFLLNSGQGTWPHSSGRPPEW